MESTRLECGGETEITFSSWVFSVGSYFDLFLLRTYLNVVDVSSGKGVPIRDVLGKSKMILGLLEGIPTMHKGEIAMVTQKLCEDHLLSSYLCVPSLCFASKITFL